MNDYINTLEAVFLENANTENAAKQAKYMKNNFAFYGINSPTRKLITRPFLVKDALPAKEDLEKIIKYLWQKPQREFQYFALELAIKYKKQIEEKDIELFEFLIKQKSWWDSIDSIAPNLVGHYFRLFPKKRNTVIEKWLNTDNLWLNRSCILFQLKYKKYLDTEFLSYVINHFIGSKEFFINKAIGWVLREYAYINPSWVIGYCEKTRCS